MKLFPVSAKEPDYPGFKKRKKATETLMMLLRVEITVPLCLMAMFSCGNAFARQPNESEILANSHYSSQIYAQLQNPQSCKGREAPPLPPPEPPACRGKESVPPPCPGEMAIPDPPPCDGSSIPPQPNSPQNFPSIQKIYKAVPLNDFVGKAKEFVGMQVRIEGVLGRSTDGSLFDNGFYIKGTPSGNSGLFSGCPLIGDLKNLQEGSSVIVEGTVVKKEQPPNPKLPSGTYFVLEVENAHLK